MFCHNHKGGTSNGKFSAKYRHGQEPKFSKALLWGCLPLPQRIQRCAAY